LDLLDSLSKRTYPGPANGEVNSKIILDSLYRRSTDRERQLLAAGTSDVAKYEAFLAQPGTGITKLIRDFGCDEYSPAAPNKQVCLEFSMPGGGSAFSFRQSDYQFWNLSDLLYDGKSFLAFGQMSLGFMTDLRDVPIESVQLDSKGISYMTRFDPGSDIATVTKQNNVFVDGQNVDGQLYKKFLSAAVDNTYVLRSVAFKGKVPRKHYEIKYNELDLDKRSDIIVAFRVVRSDINGTVTIVWKTLQLKSAPELRLAKENGKRIQ
jgi:hypothetical protein